MYKIFKHNGKQGDVIYSLPAIRELGGGILYLPESTPDEVTNMYSNMKELLELQSYIKEVREYPSGLAYKQQAVGIYIDFDMDIARDQPAKGVVHIVKRYLNAFCIDLKNWKWPWLHIGAHPKQIAGEYVVVNYTGRHVINPLMPSKPFDWKSLLRSIKEPKVFVGTIEEYISFTQSVEPMPYYKTETVKDLAGVVDGAKAVYCNQSLVLTLAQALGKTYYLYPKPFKTNCLLYTSNENILK